MASQPIITDSEEWRDIPGWGGYQASSLGRIQGPRRLLSQQINKFGYARVALTDRPNKRKKCATVHSLVCAAFIGPRPDGMQINHINNERADNRAANLEYVTAKQNCQHRRLHGTFPTGENNGRAKLTSSQVAEIRKRRANGEKLKPLSREYGVHQNTIWWIVRGTTWAE